MSQSGQYPTQHETSVGAFEGNRTARLLPIAALSDDFRNSVIGALQRNQQNTLQRNQYSTEYEESVNRLGSSVQSFQRAFKANQQAVDEMLDFMDQLAVSVKTLSQMTIALKDAVDESNAGNDKAGEYRVLVEHASNVFASEAQKLVDMESNLKKRRREMETLEVRAAGDFFIDQRFVPGKRANAEPGEFITPHTLLKYMRRWRAALKRDEVSEFTPSTAGYIPFTEIGNGLVHVEGGVDLEEIDKGKRWQYQNKGCMKTLNRDTVREIYEPAITKKRKEIQQMEMRTNEMKQAQKRILE